MKITIPSKEELETFKNRTEIKRHYHVTYKTVDKWLEYYDICLKKYPPKHNIPDDFIEVYNIAPIDCRARLAKHYGVSTPTIDRWMDEYNITPLKTNISMKKLYGDEQLYKDFSNMSLKELTEKYLDGVTTKRHKLYENASRLGLNDVIEKWKNEAYGKIPKPPKEELENLNSHLEVTRKYNVSYPVSRRWAKEYGITKFNQAIDIKKEDLIEKLNNGLSIKEISRHYKTDPVAIKRFMTRNDIQYKFKSSIWKDNRKTILENISTIEERIKKEPVYTIAKEYGVSDSLIRDILHERGIENVPFKSKSQKELHLMEYIKSLCPDTVSKRWKYDETIFEVDCLCENLKIGFEFCGLYWHSERNKHWTYHKNKLEWCKKQGIKLITIFEHEYENSFEIIKNMIRVRLGFGRKIHARKCVIHELSKQETMEFCDKNHINGYHASSVRIGLFHNDTLVSVMTLSKSRFKGKSEYEIIRMCSLDDYVIVGGASKMLKYFIKKYSPKSIMTYADRRFGEGNVYKTIGFKFIKSTQPNYVYWKNGFTVYSRQQFTKQKLIEGSPELDSSKSEHDIMLENNYLRIYDCGSNLYTMTLN